MERTDFSDSAPKQKNVVTNARKRVLLCLNIPRIKVGSVVKRVDTLISVLLRGGGCRSLIFFFLIPCEFVELFSSPMLSPSSWCRS